VINGDCNGGQCGGGGLFLTSYNETGTGRITVTNVIAESNDSENAGGGIHAESKSTGDGATSGAIVIDRCIVRDNQALGPEDDGFLSMGGGIYASSNAWKGTSADVTITNSTVSGNASEYGGGIYAHSYGYTGSGAITISGNAIKDNTASDEGGGVHAKTHAPTGSSGTTTMNENIISGNVCAGDRPTARAGVGGGVFATASCGSGDGPGGNSGNMVFTGNVVKSNSSSSGFGGGLAIESSAQTGHAGDIVCSGNTVEGNRSSLDGAGLWVRSQTYGGFSGKIKLVSNLIAGNGQSAIASGGGAWLRSWDAGSETPGAITLTGNTISSNWYGGVSIQVLNASASVRFYNNIIYDNRIDAGLARDVYLYGSAADTTAYNNTTHWYGVPSWTHSGNNSNQAPGFRRPGAWDDNGTPENYHDDIWIGGDFHLTRKSPCIDTGMNSAPEISTTDIDGDTRLLDGDGDGSACVDRGADEFASNTAWTQSLFLLLFD
jgi:hypothetical protein